MPGKQKRQLKLIGLILLCCVALLYPHAYIRSQVATVHPKDTGYFFVPEFYKPVPDTSRDTLFKFECYDTHDSIINKVADFEDVFYYSLFKNYTDSLHTYKDANGVKQFLPISKIVKRYDYISGGRWMCIGYPGNKYAEVKVDKNMIVKTDTIVTGTQVEIYKYYKVEAVNN
jgi:hypothetical protein